MTPTRRISPSEWNVHKKEIRTLYMVQKKELKEVIKHMGDAHGFFASKSQYVRKLKAWGMEKYISGEKWKHAVILAEERKLSGKETQLVIDNEVISVKRMNKEMSRYSHLRPGESSSSAVVSAKAASLGVLAYTPPTLQDQVFLTFNTSPWLHLQLSVESFLSSLGESLIPQLQASSALGLVAHPKGILQQDDGVLPKSLAIPSTLLEKAITGGNRSQAQQFIQAQPMVKLLHKVAYLSSNALLDKEKMSGFLKLVIAERCTWFVQLFIQLGGPAVEIFASRLLLCAVEHEEADLVEAILIGGANPNSRDWSSTALSMALKRRNRKLVQLLLLHGADTSRPGILNEIRSLDKVSHSSEKLNPPGLVFPQDLGTPSDKSDVPITDLSLAVRNNKLEKAAEFIRQGANVNSLYDLKKGYCCNSCQRAQPIEMAAELNLVEMAQLLLDMGASLNGPSWWEVWPREMRCEPLMVSLCYRYHGVMPALHYSAKNGNIRMAKLLLQRGVNIHRADASGNTALQIACESRHSLPMVELLVDWGADVNAPAGRHRGRTALQAAAEAGEWETMYYLLNHNADPNAAPALDYGITALCAAICHGDHVLLAPVTRLLHAGANINGDVNCDLVSFNHIPIHAAVLRKCQELLKLLIKYGANVKTIKDVNESWIDRQTEGSRLDWMEIVLILFDNGIDFSRSNFLHIAILNKDFAMCKFLLDNGANPTGCSSSERKPSSPLHKAMSSNDELFAMEALKLLVSFGVNVNSYEAIDSEARLVKVDQLICLLDNDIDTGEYIFQATPLQIASIGNHARLINLLLKLGANVNSPAAQNTGFTALQMAILAEQEGVIEVLLNAGADIHSPGGGETGFTALQCSIVVGNDQLTRKLLDAGADINAPASLTIGRTALQAAAARGNLELTRSLLTNGADVNAPPCHEDGATALQYAAMVGNFDMVVLLLEHGADIDGLPSLKYGRTALQAAAECGRQEIVHLLLENHPNLSHEECEEAAKLAYDEGYDVVARTCREWMPHPTDLEVDTSFIA